MSSKSRGPDRFFVRPVAGYSARVSNSQPNEIVAQTSQADFVLVSRHENALILHHLGEIGRLAAGRGAGVEHRFTRDRPQHFAGERGAWVLNVTIARSQRRVRLGAM